MALSHKDYKIRESGWLKLILAAVCIFLSRLASKLVMKKLHAKMQNHWLFSSSNIYFLSAKERMPKVRFPKYCGKRALQRPRKEPRYVHISRPQVWEPFCEVRWRHYISSSGCGPDLRKNGKEDEQTLKELNSADRRSQAKCQLV